MSEFSLPFTGDYPITLDYGANIPSKFGGGISSGIDYGVPLNTPILSAAEGYISNIYYNKGGGNIVEVEHAGDITTWYAHLEESTVRVGEKVLGGEQIGISGNTGEYTTGPHLLFGARLKGSAIDPDILFGKEETKSDDQGLFGIPGAIGDAAFTFGFIMLGAIVFLGGVLLMRSNKE